MNTTAREPSRIVNILLTPVAAVISLVELTLPKSERGGQL